MEAREQCEHFVKELDILCSKYAEEYDLTIYEISGMLSCKAFEIMFDNYQDDDSDQGEDETQESPDDSI